MQFIKCRGLPNFYGPVNFVCVKSIHTLSLQRYLNAVCLEHRKKCYKNYLSRFYEKMKFDADLAESVLYFGLVNGCGRV